MRSVETLFLAKRHWDATPQDDKKILSQHEAINQAIQSSDSAAAGRAMRRHLDYVSQGYRAQASKGRRPGS